jgi:hypothetical protein
MGKSRLKEAQIRDFSGGWNVADSNLNLVSKYQPVSDNVIRGSDGSFTVRWGTQLFEDAGTGTETDHGLNAFTSLETTDTEAFIIVNWTAHPFSNGEHITISGAVDVGGIPASAINRTHGVLVVDADSFKIAVRFAATSSTTLAATNINVVQDDHMCGGDILHIHYFSRKIVVYTNIGEVFTVDASGTSTRVWDYSKAEALTSGLLPTRECDLISTTTWKSKILSCNGYDKDKPLSIDENFDAEYLVDAATSSNAAVPKADHIFSLQGYVTVARTEYGPTMIEFSASKTDGTFTREAAPDDAVEVDLGGLTSTVDPVILGVNKLRDKLFVSFYDQSMLGVLGITSGSTHDPDFSDTIAEHGTVASRTMVALGNDILMADYAGVVSVGLSAQSGTYVPTRISSFIGPAISKHLAALSEETLLKKCFAIFNPNDRHYMLFVPKCDEVAQTLETDPFYFTEGLSEINRVRVYARNHKLFEGSYVTVAGCTNIGDALAASFNGVRKVIAVLDDNNFILEVDDTPSQSQVFEGGGSSVTITPVNDETICYAFEYNRELGIRRWTRIRGLNFTCGCVSQRGTTFFAKGKKIYSYGSKSNPIYADNIRDYDDHAWNTSTAYTAGHRVLDTSNNVVYVCLADHTSASSGTFATDRTNNPNNWDIYLGDAIDWSLETPWSDMNRRGVVKNVKSVIHDAEGDGRYKFSIYTSKIYRNPTTYDRAPKRSLEFVGADAPGFGVGNPHGFGSGRRTREELRWPMPCRGKLFLLRYEGSTRERVRVIATTMYYNDGNIAHRG